MENKAIDYVIVHMSFFFWQAKFKQNYERWWIDVAWVLQNLDDDGIWSKTDFINAHS
jgi:hypothetical protein